MAAVEYQPDKRSAPAQRLDTLTDIATPYGPGNPLLHRIPRSRVARKENFFEAVGLGMAACIDLGHLRAMTGKVEKHVVAAARPCGHGVECREDRRTRR